MTDSHRPPAVETIRASLPTIATVIVTVATAVWFMAGALSDLRVEIVGVRANQHHFAAGLRNAQEGQAKLREEVGAINVRISTVAVRVGDINDKISERHGRARRLHE